MSDDDKYPTIRQVLDGEAGFPSGAIHNEDGMYVLPESPTVKDDDMIQDRSGLYLPKPSSKQVTRLLFSTGMTIDVSEDYKTVYNAVKEHKTGDLVFSGPVFEGDPVIIRGTHVKSIVVITTDYRNLDEIRIQIEQHQYNQRMVENQLRMAKIQNHSVNRDRERNRRLNS